MPNFLKLMIKLLFNCIVLLARHLLSKCKPLAVPLAAAATLAFFGGITGASVGIAANGGADNGILFMALMFGLLGFFGRGWLDSKSKASKES